MAIIIIIFKLTLIFFIHFTIIGQEAMPYVIGTCGKSNNIEGKIISYTIGESFVKLLNGNGIKVLQGFQQPYLDDLLTRKRKNDELEIEVYPNPVKSNINIILISDVNMQIEINLRDVIGRPLIMKKENVNKNANIVMNVENLNKGTYLLEIKNEKYNLNRVYKIIKN